MWDSETVTRLEAWYGTPQGMFALRQEHLLFQELVSVWPRRGCTLLDVGCGSGVFLEMFWEYGFDVTGCDGRPELLAAARARLGHRAEFRQGTADRLPFDDDGMDYVALISLLGYVSDVEAALCEALRVARSGVIVGFLNRWSAYAVHDRLFRKRGEQRRGRWISPAWVFRTARRLNPQCRIRIRSVLPGPPGTWHDMPLWGRLNRVLLPLPLGAYVGMCIDIRIPPPLTPIPLRVRLGAEETPICGTAASWGARRSTR